VKRQRLIWFAIGAAACAAASTLSFLLISVPSDSVPYLQLREPTPQKKDDQVVTYAGRLLRECGAAKFDITLWGIDVQSYAYLPIKPENSKVVQCVIDRARSQNVDFDIVFKSDDHAQTH
jgi:hypothetical protein